MRTFARQVRRRAVVIGVVLIATLMQGWEWLPWAVVVASVAAGREAWLWRRHGLFVESVNATWVRQAGRSRYMGVHRQDWAPLAIEAGMADVT